MRPWFTANSEDSSLVDCITDRVLKAGEAVSSNHSANIRCGWYSVSGALQRVAWAQLLRTLGEHLEEVLVL